MTEYEGPRTRVGGTFIRRGTAKVSVKHQVFALCIASDPRTTGERLHMLLRMVTLIAPWRGPMPHVRILFTPPLSFLSTTMAAADSFPLPRAEVPFGSNL